MSKGSCRTFFILLSWLAMLSVQAQNGRATVKVVSSQSGFPIADVTVKAVLLNPEERNGSVAYGLTNTSGEFFYTFTEPVIVQVSHIGYITLTDTLYTLSHKTYMLTNGVKEMKEVVVTGQYAAGSVQKSVYEIKVISQQELQAKGANNLREALQTKLNVDLGQDAVFGSSMSINGISGEGIKIMVDGVPIVGRLDGKIDLNQINLNNIDHIEIIEGPLSVIYGTDAMGGVINVITKTFQKEKVNLNLKGYYETVGQYNIELNTGFSFKKNQLYLSGGRYFFDGFTTLDSIDRFQEWKPKEQYFADAKYVLADNKYRLSLTGSFFRELLLDRSAPHKSLSYDNGDTAWTYTGDDGHYLSYRPRAAASFMYQIKEGSQFDALLAYSGFFRLANRYSKNLVTGKEQLVADNSLHDTTRYHQITARATYSIPFLKYKLLAQFGVAVDQEYTRQTKIENKKQQYGDYAAFGSLQLKFVEGLTIQPAIRFSYNTRFRVPLIPSLNLHYQIKNNIVLRASYGRGYRAPSLKEMYLVFFDSNHSLKGNAQLKPEDGHCVNLSINTEQAVRKNHFIQLSASGFYNNINNKIDWKLIPSMGPEPDTFEYFNIKKYITYGGALTLGYRWQRLQLSGSAQCTRYELSTTTGTIQTKAISADVSATASYLIPKAEIGININYKYNGAKPLFSVNSSMQTGMRHAYHTLNISFTRNFWKDRIQCVVGGKNLVGVTNVQADNTSGVGHSFSGNMVNIAWGRTFFTSIIFHFSK